MSISSRHSDSNFAHHFVIHWSLSKVQIESLHNILHERETIYDKLIFVAWSRGMSRMSGILILSYKLREVTNSYVLNCFWTSKNRSHLRNQMSNWDGIWIKIWHFKWTTGLYWKLKIEYCWHVTHSPWSCHIFHKNGKAKKD